MCPSMADLEKDDIPISKPVSAQQNINLSGRHGSIPASGVPQPDQMTDLERRITQHGFIDWDGPEDPVSFLSII